MTTDFRISGLRQAHRNVQLALGRLRIAKDELLTAVLDCRQAGWTHAEIGEAIGVGKSRAARLASQAAGREEREGAA